MVSAADLLGRRSIMYTDGPIRKKLQGREEFLRCDDDQNPTCTGTERRVQESTATYAAIN